MPEMDGLETLRRLRREYPQLRVIMLSTLTERGAAITIEALTLCADDYVQKATNEASLERSIDRLRQELLPKIRQFFRFPGSTGALATPVAANGSIAAAALQGLRPRPKALAIGVSTGGPTALGAVLPQLPESFPLPVLVVQHMPPLFTRFLAERLDATCSLSVTEAANGMQIAPGTIFIAPGDFHMKVATAGNGVSIHLDQSPPLNSCRPAVDALLGSLAEIYGGAILTVILTGMGQDGLRGVEVLKKKGATVLAQDEASSVVWGMPGAVVNAGLADRVLPLDQVIPEVLRRVALG
jgi:two-component system, chemotaxis family, protein-glutamate methylesterase/glutaminase